MIETRLMRGKYFTKRELSCPCCSKDGATDELVAALDQLREIAKSPIVVHSAYRCAIHNTVVGGAADGYHPQGKAADIHIPGLTLRQMFNLTLQVPAFANGGIGLYDGKPFIHVDVRGRMARWARVGGRYKGIDALLPPIPVPSDCGEAPADA
jgi:hypothetical protein